MSQEPGKKAARTKAQDWALAAHLLRTDAKIAYELWIDASSDRDAWEKVARDLAEELVTERFAHQQLIARTASAGTKERMIAEVEKNFQRGENPSKVRDD